MDALTYIVDKYKLNANQGMPVEIPNVGRRDLAGWFGELGFTKGAEIGTAGGKFAEIICSSSPSVHLYCVDAYAIYNGYRDYTRTEQMTKMHTESHERLKKYNVEFVEQFSMDALNHFEDNSLDFVYIDANHEWPFVTQDIYYWSKKVRPGGIVAGHDYYRSNRKDSKCHVRGAVNGYTYAFRVDPWFILGRDEKRAGEIRDNSRSWMWIK